MSESNNQIKLFISYSHNDSIYFNTLSEGLGKVVKNSSKFNWTIWDDTKIHVGTFWDKEIQNNIEDCNVALLLVILGFMSSNYIKEKEFNEFKKKHEENGILIFPVVFNPCDFNQWEDLSKLQFFKPNGSLYGKPETKNFTYVDLFKFTETNGVLIPNPNLDRYHIDLFNQIEISFSEFLNRKKKDNIENIISNSQTSNNTINKLSDYPKPSSLFTGREKEIKQLNNAIEINRIISIEGLGGTGKTQVCSKYIDKYIVDKNKIIWLDGSTQSNFNVFVENAGYGDVLKGVNKSNLALYSGFKDLIEKDERIIFWDNFNDYEDKSFNQFISFANNYLQKSTIVLITKTEPNIDGIISLNSIKIEGLNDNALEYAKKIKLSNSKYSSISEFDLDKICNAVEGHPLAIEFSMLLVSYGKTVDEIILNFPDFTTIKKVEEFSKRLFLDILNHNKTSEEERELFKLSSVFKEKFSIEEITFIFNGKDVFHIITGLIDKLLIKSKDSFFQIHPLVRSFSYEMLDNKQTVNHKVAEFFISKRSNKIDISLEEKILYHLSESESWNEIANFIEEKGRIFIQLGQLGILLDIINKTINQNIYKPIFNILLGDIFQIKSEWDKSSKYFKIASENDYDKAIKAEGLIKIGEILYRKGVLKESLSFFEKAYNFSKSNNLLKEEARALNDIGLVHHDFDEFDISFEKYNLSLNIRKKINDLEGIAITKNNLANNYASKNDFGNALKLYNESICISEEIQDKANLSIYRMNLASTLRRQNKLNEALNKVELAMKTLLEIGDKAGLELAYNNLGIILCKQGKLKEGLNMYKQALIVSEEIGNKRGISSSYSNLSSYYFDNSDLEKSVFYSFKSLSIEIETGNILDLKNITYWINDLNKKIGNDKFKKIAEIVYENLNEDEKKNIDIKQFYNEPITKINKKLNRNDFINVSYENGTINSGKYKKFEVDLLNGKCQIID